MRSVLVACGISVSSVALAQPAEVPDRCKAVASAPASARIERPALGAKLSLATCSAAARFAVLKLTPDDASIKALANAARPSLDLYDEVIRANDPVLTPVARTARANLLLGMAVRMRSSIPPITMQTLAQALANHAEIELKIKPWLDQAK
jgi:hypothetical protein